jgi:spectinomycin phosphotransferase
LNVERDRIRHLVERAEQLAEALQSHSLEYVLCHTDIHAANLLMTGDALYIVDWDAPILAPKERDLMFIGGGIGEIWNTAREEALFYQGYGHTQIDFVALAYYRYERIVQDIVAYSEQLLLTHEGGADREEAFRRVTSQFLLGHVAEAAYQSEKLLPPELRSLPHGN